MPWNEHATLVRVPFDANGDDQASEVLLEGLLRDVAAKVRDMKALERRGLRISLPDRRVRPYSFKGADLDALIKQFPVGAR
jgi:hypothetical protein